MTRPFNCAGSKPVWGKIVAIAGHRRPTIHSEQGPHERRLLADLLANYNTLERPVLNESEPLILSFGLTLQQIIDVVSLRLPNRKDYHHPSGSTHCICPPPSRRGSRHTGGPDFWDSPSEFLTWELGQEQVYRRTRLR
ncbi:hypothetical protein HPB48_019765 [Haemaphysalis longicornis]|uniref:Neurotransmitter-gated ion-channel ligand-binding domain-containing protein n=1 Tax=Haemaphysalis longicornis TaxID=44386 RepID=A0A9J6GPL5_HAELO|nr:hypothetical protein HPB48_019765 [Haemaphysalis longicornis]